MYMPEKPRRSIIVRCWKWMNFGSAGGAPVVLWPLLVDPLLLEAPGGDTDTHVHNEEDDDDQNFERYKDDIEPDVHVS